MAVGLLTVVLQQFAVAQEAAVSDAYAKTPGLYFSESSKTIAGLSQKQCEAKCTAGELFSCSPRKHLSEPHRELRSDPSGCCFFIIIRVPADDGCHAFSFAATEAEGGIKKQCTTSSTQIYYLPQ